MARLLVALLLVASFALGAAFSYYNWTEITVHYLAGEARLPLIAVLLGAFVCGAFVMWLLSFARLFVLGRETRRQQRKIRDLEAELKSLRNLPLEAPPAAAGAPPTTGKNA